MYCKDCKHWKPDSDRMCNSPKVNYGYGPRKPECNIKVETDEGWGMIVDADFGCVNFEAKKDEL